MSVLMDGPGVYRDMPGNEYYSFPFLSASSLKDCNWNTRKLHAKLTERQRPATEAMVFGTAFHTVCLEPAEVAQEYHILPEGHKGTTKDGKALVAEIKKQGKRPLKKAAYQQIQAMRKSMLTHPWVKKHFDITKGDIELSIFTDYEGVRVKSRLDTYRPEEGGYSIDLKTTIDASNEKWRKEVRNGYITQAAVYQKQLLSHGLPCKGFYFVAVEKEAPYNVGVHTVAQRDLDAAWERVRDLLARYNEDRKSGFPHYNTEPTIHTYMPQEIKI